MAVWASPSSDWGEAGKLLARQSPDAAAIAGFSDALDTTFAKGAWIAWSTSPAPDQHQEDDNVPFTATLHGAVTTWSGLELAARAAVLLEKKDAAKRWADLATVTSHIELKSEGSAYFLKNMVATAAAGDAATRDNAQAPLKLIAGHATPGTHHFGEVMLTEGAEGSKTASQRVANPHLWEGTLFYLTPWPWKIPRSCCPSTPPRPTPTSKKRRRPRASWRRKTMKTTADVRRWPATMAAGRGGYCWPALARLRY